VLTSRDLESATATVVCPRCGSDSVVPARSGDASEYVFQLRDGSAPAARADAFDEWLCMSCGLRWPHETSYDGAAAEPGTGPDVAISEDLLAMIHLPEAQRGAGVTSPRVARELRAAREARGLSVADAANATRIWGRYLSALEANAPMDEFPAPAYARFFLRSYAEFLGMNPDTIVHEFDEDHPVPEEPVLRTVPYERPRRRWVAGALVFLSIAALVALGVVRLQQGKDEPLPPAGAVTNDQGSEPPSTAAQPPPTKPPVVDHIRVVLQANDRSWVEVHGDGQTLEAGVVLEAGQHAVYRADRRLEITLGNAGGVILDVNGEPVQTGGAGSVVTLAFKLRDGEIVTRTL
jgi:transcriptional regulator with XRE-family HTH domain